MKSITLFLAYLAASASALQLPFFETSHEYSCIGSRKPCKLQDVVLESENDLDRATFPAITDPLIIESGRIPHFTRKLAEKLAGIVDLAVNHLQLKTLYIKPEMTHLEAKDNQIETLLVDSTNKYQLLTLDLTGNMLSNVEILSRFTELRQLTLDQNKLEKLSMDVFSDMAELRKLSLANNQLFTINTEKSLQLIKLRSLSLAGNQLMELNVEKWELDSLTELNLSNNKLYLLGGHLGQFKSLVDVKISENYWKCEFLAELNRLERLMPDRDESDRCKKNEMFDVKGLCCENDASKILGYTAAGDLGLFHDKWEELRQLNATFEHFKNVTDQNQQRIGDLEEYHEVSLVQRIKVLEEKQQKILDKLDDQEESVAVKEINELKTVVSSHGSTLQQVVPKQLNLESELKSLAESLDSFREIMNEKLVAVDKVNEKVIELEDKAKNENVEKIEKSVTELREAFKYLEGQQLRYFLSSVDLKKQIGTERSKVTEVQQQCSKLHGETDRLREQMGNAQNSIDMIFNILKEMSSSEV